MRRFSSEEDRSHVFASASNSGLPEVQEGNWIDLYQLLEIEPDAPSAELDERIIERGADVVYFAVSRHGKPPHIAQLEKHLPEMRPVLLNPEARQRYDEFSRLHREKAPGTPTYAEFLKTIDLREYSGCMSVLIFACLPALAWLLMRIT